MKSYVLNYGFGSTVVLCNDFECRVILSTDPMLPEKTTIPVSDVKKGEGVKVHLTVTNDNELSLMYNDKDIDLQNLTKEQIIYFKKVLSAS